MLFNTLIYVFHILSARDTFSFDVAAGTRVIQLRANNLDSMNIWIHTINAVIADKWNLCPYFLLFKLHFSVAGCEYFMRRSAGKNYFYNDEDTII